MEITVHFFNLLFVFIFQVITHVTTGHILDCPPRVCSEEVYKIMLGCWRQEPQGRFTMKTVYYHIDRLCMSQPTYLDLIA